VAIFGDEVSLACAGATDRGVHALAQVVSFHTRAPLALEPLRAAIVAPPSRGATTFRELDDVLQGRSFQLRELTETPRSFHASFSALARRYRFRADSDVDPAGLQRMLEPLVGERCFSAFARDTPPGKRSVKRLLSVQVSAAPDGANVEMAASGFLRRQVRVMMATALRELARGAPPEALLELASRGDRRLTAPPAPADRLCLWAVDYPSESGAPSLLPSTALNVERSSSPDAAATQRSPS
jgi:tRNA pseudouridine38-40 synthase